MNRFDLVIRGISSLFLLVLIASGIYVAFIFLPVKPSPEQVFQNVFDMELPPTARVVNYYHYEPTMDDAVWWEIEGLSDDFYDTLLKSRAFVKHTPVDGTGVSGEILPE